jgi:hypothetical protein
VDYVLNANKETIKGTALGEGQLVEAASMAEDEVWVEVRPGFDSRLTGTNVSKEGGCIGFGGEVSILEEVESVSCAEEVGLFSHFGSGEEEGKWMRKIV